MGKLVPRWHWRPSPCSWPACIAAACVLQLLYLRAPGPLHLCLPACHRLCRLLLRKLGCALCPADSLARCMLAHLLPEQWRPAVEQAEGEC